MNYIIDKPSGNFSIKLPITIKKEFDERVASYWLENESVLLQFSSNIRYEGKQISAAERMANRINQDRIKVFDHETFTILLCQDISGFSYVDKAGVKWIFCYAVWPDLTILCTISGNLQEIEEKGDWAFEAIESIRRT